VRRSGVLVAHALLFCAPLAGYAETRTAAQEALQSAHKVGWVWLEISDDQVPDVPSPSLAEDELGRPGYCAVSLLVDGVPWHLEELFPFGASAPYTVKAEIRFPVPPGEAVELSLRYDGCRVLRGRPIRVRASASFTPIQGLTQDLRFDGGELSTRGAPGEQYGCGFRDRH